MSHSRRQSRVYSAFSTSRLRALHRRAADLLCVLRYEQPSRRTLDDRLVRTIGIPSATPYSAESVAPPPLRGLDEASFDISFDNVGMSELYARALRHSTTTN
jgi:hypothetical protein